MRRAAAPLFFLMVAIGLGVNVWAIYVFVRGWFHDWRVR
jgi:hypothetical protein